MNFDDHPRWVLDASSVFKWGMISHLQGIHRCLPELRKRKPAFFNPEHNLDHFDRPFVILPPCWSEMSIGLQVAKNSHLAFAAKMEETISLLNDLVAANLVTRDIGDRLEEKEKFRSERKLLWLKIVQEKLQGLGKKIVFVTENPLFLMRSYISGIPHCTTEEMLLGEEPRDTFVRTDDIFRENVFLVDKRVLATSAGATLTSHFGGYHEPSKPLKIFLTHDVQVFAQNHQFRQDGGGLYPFTFRDPEHPSFSGRPDHTANAECLQEENGCQVVNHVVESYSLLADSVDFEKAFTGWIIGEPFGTTTADEINLEQVAKSAHLYIISDNDAWANETKFKVIRCRTDIHVRILDFKTAFDTFRRKPSALNQEYVVDDEELAENEKKKFKLDPEPASVFMDYSGTSASDTVS